MVLPDSTPGLNELAVECQVLPGLHCNVGLPRVIGAAIVVIWISVPLIEPFDTWDHTLKDGNDTQANLVVADSHSGSEHRVAQPMGPPRLPVHRPGRCEVS